MALFKHTTVHVDDTVLAMIDNFSSCILCVRGDSSLNALLMLHTYTTVRT